MKQVQTVINQEILILESFFNEQLKSKIIV